MERYPREMGEGEMESKRDKKGGGRERGDSEGEEWVWGRKGRSRAREIGREGKREREN